MSFKKIAPLILALFLAVLLIVRTECVSDTVVKTSHLCADTIFPSLFPFMVLSNFISIYLKGSKKSASFSAIILGIIGGYPVGIKTVATLLENKKIDIKDAQILSLFCFGSGPAFLISTIGVGFFHSIKIGVVLFLSQLITTLIIGLLVLRKYKISSESNQVIKNVSLTDALTTSVSKSVEGIFLICAYIIIFSVFISLVTSFYNTDKIRLALSVFEVTNGCNELSISGSSLTTVPLAAALLSFGGLCVHAQVLSDLKYIGLDYKKFLIVRVCAAGISFLTCRTILLLVPFEISVFSNLGAPVTAQLGASGTIIFSMLLTTVLLIFDLDINREIC
ncbi:MAG: hypothetical protein PUD72_08105 [Oscillospiraceae bacterium]|nr:hypothetical protein [Oscillospiraceae bacterium]